LAERASLSTETLRRSARLIDKNLVFLGGGGLTSDSWYYRTAAAKEVISVGLATFQDVVIDVAALELNSFLPLADDLLDNDLMGVAQEASRTRYLLGAAHQIFVCALPTPVGLTRLVAMLSQLVEVWPRSEAQPGAKPEAKPHIKVVLNKCPRGRQKALIQEVSALLRTHANGEQVIGVTSDLRGFAKAQEQAKPLARASPRSPARRGLKEMRDSLVIVTESTIVTRSTMVTESIAVAL
jgi:hypothetical protein